MPTLNERLQRIKAGFAEEAPEDAKAKMARATEELRSSGILAKLPKVGDALAAFALPDTEGAVVRSDDLLSKGPLVVTFYRGVW